MPTARQIENLLAELRGLPIDTSRSRQRPTLSAHEAVIQALQTYRVGVSSPERELAERWVAIAGPGLGQRSHPVQVAPGAVTIAVNHPTVRQELEWRRGSLLEAIRAVPGCEGTERIRFRHT